jgi:ribosomal protein L37AE/L43A
MDALESSTPMRIKHTEMEPARESVAPKNQVSKYVCPQCDAEIHWHLDGKYWHGECSGCAMELSGKINDPVHPATLPEDHVCLNIRGC